MLSDTVKRIRHSTSFRLTLVFFAIFMVGYVLLFALSIYLMDVSLLRKEQTLILARVDRYVEIDTAEGYEAVWEAITNDADDNSKLGIFARIIGTDGKTALSVEPYNWSDDKTNIDDWIISPGEGQWFMLVERDAETESSEALLLTSRILSNDFVLQIGRSDRERELLIANFREVFSLFMIPVFCVSVILGLLLSWRATRPIQDLIKTVSKIQIGDLKARVPVRNPNNDLGILSGLFNTMLERIDTLIKGMKASLDNVAHDLRTPLSRMRANLEMELRSGNDSTSTDALSDCIESVDQIETMLKAIMDITRAESGILPINPEELSPAEVFDEILAIYELVAEEKNIEMISNVESSMSISADRIQLKQLVANLLDNAIKYSNPDTQVQLNAYVKDNRGVIEVIDQGMGIPEEETDLVFDRLYRVDKSRSEKGLGLGLSIVRAIAQAHGASVKIESRVNEGSVFRVIFKD